MPRLISEVGSRGTEPVTGGICARTELSCEHSCDEDYQRTG